MKLNLGLKRGNKMQEIISKYKIKPKRKITEALKKDIDYVFVVTEPGYYPLVFGVFSTYEKALKYYRNIGHARNEYPEILRKGIDELCDDIKNEKTNV
jgi:hypothetical protein